jgi:hypothetical protein
MVQASTLNSVLISRLSVVNWDITAYSINIGMLGAIISSSGTNWINFTFPS